MAAGLYNVLKDIYDLEELNMTMSVIYHALFYPKQNPVNYMPHIIYKEQSSETTLHYASHFDVKCSI